MQHQTKPGWYMYVLQEEENGKEEETGDEAITEGSTTHLPVSEAAAAQVLPLNPQTQEAVVSQPLNVYCMWR